MRLSGRIIAGAALILLGVLWLLQTTDVVNVDGDLIAPIALVVIGVLLAVSARHGLHVPLFVAGIVLTVVLAGNDVGTSTARRLEREPRTNQTEIPTSPAELRPYRLGAGTLTIDLTRLPLERDASYHVEGRVGAGRIEVFVPSGVSVKVTARTGAGNISIFGRRSSGLGSDTTSGIEYPNRAHFDIELRAGVGSVVVRHSLPKTGLP